MKIPELLVPAGDMEKLKVAIHFGADAVYIGGYAHNLRTKSRNFSISEMEEAVTYAHTRGVKVYVTLNTYPTESQIIQVEHFVCTLRTLNIDGIIAADPGVILYCIETLPTVPIHISTQMNITNSHHIQFWNRYKQIKRICLARELSLEEICGIRKKTGIELEIFVHGAMCISYSGRCLLSAYFNRRSANLGNCSHPCRWKYVLMEKTRPFEYFPVFQDDIQGSFIMSSRDLCMAHHIPEVCDAGIDAFKIEGRIKGVHYLACVTRLYRNILDAYLSKPNNFQFKDVWRDELHKINSRGYFTGFYFGNPADDGQLYDSRPYLHQYAIAGVVTDILGHHDIEVRVKSAFRPGDILELVSPQIKNQAFCVDKITTREGKYINCTKPNQHVILNLPFHASTEDILRFKLKNGNKAHIPEGNTQKHSLS